MYRYQIRSTLKISFYSTIMELIPTASNPGSRDRTHDAFLYSLIFCVADQSDYSSVLSGRLTFADNAQNVVVVHYILQQHCQTSSSDVIIYNTWLMIDSCELWPRTMTLTVPWRPETRYMTYYYFFHFRVTIFTHEITTPGMCMIAISLSPESVT